MTKVVKKTKEALTAETNLLSEILSLCIDMPDKGLAIIIRKKIENAQISIQMEKDLIRRSANPVSNALDLNFQKPIQLLTKKYNSNLRLRDVMTRLQKA